MTALSKVFWGLLLVFLDIRINGFDLLPDLIGYLLVYPGLSRMSARHPHFRKAKMAVLPLLLFSLPELLGLSFQINLSSSDTSVSGWMIVAIIVMELLHLYMIYHLCRGIAKLASQSGSMALANLANSRWTYYLWFSLVFSALTLLALVDFLSVLTLLFIPVAIVGFIIYILLLLIIRQADRILRL